MHQSTSVPRITLLLVVSALLLFLFSGAGPLFQFDRDLVFTQPWRLLSGHLTHWHANHLVWDLVMFAAAGWFCETRDPVGFLICLLSSALTIAVGVVLFLPQMQYYRGLSGIDSGLFVLLALHLAGMVRPGYRWLAYLALAGFVAKLVFEMLSDRALFVVSDAVFLPVPLAHLLGALCGLAVYLGRAGCNPRAEARPGEHLTPVPF